MTCKTFVVIRFLHEAKRKEKSPERVDCMSVCIPNGWMTPSFGLKSQGTCNEIFLAVEILFRAPKQEMTSSKSHNHTHTHTYIFKIMTCLFRWTECGRKEGRKEKWHFHRARLSQVYKSLGKQIRQNTQREDHVTQYINPILKKTQRSLKR